METIRILGTERSPFVLAGTPRCEGTGVPGCRWELWLQGTHGRRKGTACVQPGGSVCGGWAVVMAAVVVVVAVVLEVAALRSAPRLVVRSNTHTLLSISSLRRHTAGRCLAVVDHAYAVETVAAMQLSARLAPLRMPGRVRLMRTSADTLSFSPWKGPGCPLLHGRGCESGTLS